MYTYLKSVETAGAPQSALALPRHAMDVQSAHKILEKHNGIQVWPEKDLEKEILGLERDEKN